MRVNAKTSGVVSDETHGTRNIWNDFVDPIFWATAVGYDEHYVARIEQALCEAALRKVRKLVEVRTKASAIECDHSCTVLMLRWYKRIHDQPHPVFIAIDYRLLMVVVLLLIVVHVGNLLVVGDEISVPISDIILRRLYGAPTAFGHTNSYSELDRGSRGRCYKSCKVFLDALTSPYGSLSSGRGARAGTLSSMLFKVPFFARLALSDRYSSVKIAETLIPDGAILHRF